MINQEFIIKSIIAKNVILWDMIVRVPQAQDVSAFTAVHKMTTIHILFSTYFIRFNYYTLKSF